jgi:hypothetical protein
MKHTKIIFVLLVIVILISSSAALGAPAEVQESEDVEEISVFVYTPGVDDPPELLAITGAVDLVTQGTGWVQERKFKYSKWKHYGWGTLAQTYKTPRDEWVHLPVTYATRIDNTFPMKVEYVEFCAQSTNGTVTKPVTLHVRNQATLMGSKAIAWPADNAYHCAGMSFSPNKYGESLGISVKLHFENNADQITLYKGWVRLQPP